MAGALNFDVRVYGDPVAQACVVSIVGTGASMNMMTPILEALVERGLSVINFNPRDVCGTEVFKQMESTFGAKELAVELGKLLKADGSLDLEQELYVPYDWYDLADDVAAVMDRIGVKKASIMGFSTGGGIAQVAMCRLKERLSSAVLCSSSFDLLPSEMPFENPRLQELMAAAASIKPEASKEERVKALLPSMMAIFEVSESDQWRETLRRGIEVDAERGWVDVYGGVNPFAMLAWAGFARTHEGHVERLRQNEVPCLVVHGKQDPLVPYRQGERLAEHTGRCSFLSHDHGHILGPEESRGELLDAIADFVKEHSE